VRNGESESYLDIDEGQLSQGREVAKGGAKTGAVHFWFYNETIVSCTILAISPQTEGVYP